MSSIYINYGLDSKKMAYEIMKTAKVERELKSGMRVVIKPNLVVSRPASEGATTHPELVEGVVRYLMDCGITDITIAEGAWVGDNTQSAFQRCGYQDLESRYGVTLVDTKKDQTYKVTSHGFDLQLCRVAVEADYLINIPVLKGHCQTNMTCCLKNLKGCIPDSEKRRFHASGLHKPIAALASALRPHLHIIDSICGDLTFEEGGNPVESNRVILGFDPVLLDSYGAHLLGYQPEEITHLRLARDYGVGEFYNRNTQMVELNKENRPKAAPTRSRVVRQLARYVEENGACSACYAALIFALHNISTVGIEDKTFKIGQGFRGKQFDGIGIGDCTKACRRHVAGCPPTASDIVTWMQQEKF